MHKAKDGCLATNSCDNNKKSGSTPTLGTVMQVPSSGNTAAKFLRLSNDISARQEKDELKSGSERCVVAEHEKKTRKLTPYHRHILGP
jgi:hypothetical protein